jgi:hypothetical protein
MQNLSIAGRMWCVGCSMTFDVHCFGRKKDVQHPECEQSEPKFSIKKLNQIEGKEQYHVEISNRFTALENLDTEVDINRASKNVRISKFQPKRI